MGLKNCGGKENTYCSNNSRHIFGITGAFYLQRQQLCTVLLELNVTPGYQKRDPERRGDIRWLEFQCARTL